MPSAGGKERKTSLGGRAGEKHENMKTVLWEMLNCHRFPFEQFLGRWSGVELYSHAENQSYDDTCLRLKITEVNEVSRYEFTIAFKLKLIFSHKSRQTCWTH